MDSVDNSGERDVAEKCAGSGNQTESARLRYRSQQDALDLVDHNVEHGKGWRANEFRNFAERYVKGELEVVFEVPARLNTPEYHLIFFVIPRGHKYFPSSDVARALCDEVVAVQRSTEDAVLTVIAEPIQCPDGFVPSLVRLERPKQREDIRRKIFAPSATYHIRFELGGTIGNREMGALRIGDVRKNGCNIPGLIKGGTEVFNSFDCNTGHLARHLPSEADLVKFVAGIRISLNDSGIWCTLEEGLSIFDKGAKLKLCAADSLLRAGERVLTHGKS
jgi:hypothetical protein